MTNQCPNCGGELVFDIKSQKVICRSCNSKFRPESLKDSTQAEESSMETTVFTCPNCGGELMAPEGSTVDYCSFCGSFVTLKSRLEKIRRPEYIAPFKLDEEDCIEAYRKKIKTNIFLPRTYLKDLGSYSFRRL